MSNDPHSVPLSKVLAFLRDLGLDPVEAADLRSVSIDQDGVTVVRFRRNEQGRRYLVGDDVAKETVTLALGREA